MRANGDNAAVARGLVREIRKVRHETSKRAENDDGLVLPDGMRRAYILDSLRHPAEVFLLRNLYQSAFALIGVVCEEDARIQRLTDKFVDAGRARAVNFMKRDSSAKEKHGQRVEKAFHLADYFIDNSVTQYIGDPKDKVSHPEWSVSEQL